MRRPWLHRESIGGFLHFEMIVMTIIIILIGVCGYWVCPDPRSETPPEDEIHYFRDSRTGICFAQFGYARTTHGNYTFTQVPCDLAFKENR